MKKCSLTFAGKRLGRALCAPPSFTFLLIFNTPMKDVIIINRVILIVLDGVGIGELPDAADYGDAGSNTLLNIRKAAHVALPNMLALGLSNIDGAQMLADKPVKNPLGAFGKLAEASKGKDTTIGHWEIAGLHIPKPFPTYPDGFPDDVIRAFEDKTRRGVIGNCAASGTEIIKRLGEEQMKTGALIVYTSADSVFQIAAHENVVPVDALHEYCRIARDMLVGAHNVARVIARPFTGEPGNFTRTCNRKDFSLKPPRKTMLDMIKATGKQVVGVGKIEDIFAGEGLTDAVHTSGNMDGVDKTLNYMGTIEDGLIFTNLVDFDMLYGHRNDVTGFVAALVDFDNRLPEIVDAMRDEDMLMITADHGCDPTTAGTDHSREYIPLLVYGKNVMSGVNLRTRRTFADIAATVLDYLGVDGEVRGTSFLNEIRRENLR